MEIVEGFGGKNKGGRQISLMFSLSVSLQYYEKLNGYPSVIVVYL